MTLPPHTPNLVSTQLADAERRLQADGFAVIQSVGIVIGGQLHADRALALAARFGTPSSRDGGTPLWSVRPMSSNPQETFSRRAGGAELHTDSAYHDFPEDRFVLYCVRAADDGGVTRLLRFSDAVNGLDEPLRRLLACPVWHWQRPAIFGTELCRPARVISETGAIRWRHDLLRVSAPLLRAADMFQHHLEEHPAVLEIALATDTMLICDNHRVLHGRTPFTDSRRRLARIRLAARR